MINTRLPFVGGMIVCSVAASLFQGQCTAVNRVQAGSGGSIVGRIVDAVTARPVCDFEIGVKRGTRAEGYLWRTEEEFENTGRRIRHLGPPRSFLQVQSDRGMFKLADVGEGTVTLFVQAHGYAIGAHQVKVVPTPGAPSEVLIELRSHRGYKGIARDMAGVSIPSAEVYAGPLPGDLLKLEKGAPRPLTKSDSQGAFQLPGMPDDVQIITVFHGQHAPAVAYLPLRGGPLTAMEIVLGLNCTLEGRVALGAQPMDMCAVTFRMSTSEGDVWLQACTTTREDGTFRIAHLPAGQIEVDCDLSSYAMRIAIGSDTIPDSRESALHRDLEQRLIREATRRKAAHESAGLVSVGAQTRWGLSPGPSFTITKSVEIEPNKSTWLDMQFPEATSYVRGSVANSGGSTSDCRALVEVSDQVTGAKEVVVVQFEREANFITPPLIAGRAKVTLYDPRMRSESKPVEFVLRDGNTVDVKFSASLDLVSIGED